MRPRRSGSSIASIRRRSSSTSRRSSRAARLAERWAEGSRLSPRKRPASVPRPRESSLRYGHGLRPVGRIYLERGEPVVVLIQWGLKSRGESHGGPRNVLIERETGELVVRSFRGLRPAYTRSRGNEIPRFAAFDYLDPEALALYDGQKSKPCGYCGQHLDPDVQWWEAHDPCIAGLPGVTAACCGHGDTSEPDQIVAGGELVDTKGMRFDRCYLLFDDGLRLDGNAARAAMRILGGNPPDAPADIDSRRAFGWSMIAEYL